MQTASPHYYSNLAASFKTCLFLDILILFSLATKLPEEVHGKVSSGCRLDQVSDDPLIFISKHWFCVCSTKAGHDGWHLAHRPLYSPLLLWQTSSINHRTFSPQSRCGLRDLLKTVLWTALPMYWCWQVRWNIFAIPEKHHISVTQTNAFHSDARTIHEHMLAHLHASVFLKMWLTDLLHQTILVFLLKCKFLTPTLEWNTQNFKS